MERLRVLILAYAVDGDDVGGVYSAFKWVEALTKKADVTILTTHRHTRRSPAEQLPLAEVVTWPEPKFLYTRFERFNAMVKPWQPVFGFKATAWLRAYLDQGKTFDIAHQLSPQAMRYACPLRHFDIPYVIGPLDGGLDTPPGFLADVGQDRGVMRFRVLDRWRLRYDRMLRNSYRRASMLLGSAPYVQKHLAAAGLGHLPFRPILERGHGPLPELPQRQAEPGRLRLLHVGRTIRTKALRDVVRAMAQLRDLPGVTLTSAGEGPDLDACRAEAEALGVADRITFLGRISREQVDAEYRMADAFCFPSFREPMGGVFFEAMEWGLPVIAASRGGPDFIIDDDSGIRLSVETPEQFAGDIAGAIRKLAVDPTLRQRLGQGARARIASFGTWDDKAAQTIVLYREILAKSEGRCA